MGQSLPHETSQVKPYSVTKAATVVRLTSSWMTNPHSRSHIHRFTSNTSAPRVFLVVRHTHETILSSCNQPPLPFVLKLHIRLCHHNMCTTDRHPLGRINPRSSKTTTPNRHTRQCSTRPPVEGSNRHHPRSSSQHSFPWYRSRMNRMTQ